MTAPATTPGAAPAPGVDDDGLAPVGVLASFRYALSSARRLRTEVLAGLTDIARDLASVAAGDLVQEEDMGICRSVQRGLQSRAYDTGRLSARREAGEHLFHRLLHADVSAGL